MNPYRLSSVANHVPAGEVPFFAWRAAVLSMFLGAVVCCGGGLSDADKTDLTNAARLDGMAYGHADAGDPLGALVRGAYCANAAVLRNQKMAVPDAGIACGPQ